MESLCEHRPAEAITILKRAIQMTVLTGLVLVAMAARGLYTSWHSTENGDKVLRYWAVIRVVGFVAQIPARIRIWNYIAWVQSTSEYRTQMIDRLLSLLHSHPWRVTQYSGAFITTWTLLTLLITPFFGLSFPTDIKGGGYLSPTLFRVAFLSIVLAVSHVMVVVLWLQTIYDSTLQMYNQYGTADDSHDWRSSENSNDSLNCKVDDSLLRSVTTLIRIEDEQISKKIDDNNEAESRRDCAVCLGRFHSGEWVMMINHCSHRFHQECIEQWIRTRARCPLCNYLLTISDVPLPSPILLPLSTAASAMPSALNLAASAVAGIDDPSETPASEKTPRLFSPFLMDTDEDESDQQQCQNNQQSIQPSVSSPLSGTPRMNRWTSWPALEMSSNPDSPAHSLGYDLESPRPSVKFTWSETHQTASPRTTRVERNEVKAQSRQVTPSSAAITAEESPTLLSSAEFRGSRLRRRRRSNGRRRELLRRDSLTSLANVWDFMHL